ENHLMLKYLTEKYIEKGILISVSIDDNCIGLLVINNYDFGENVILEDLLLLKLLGSTLANIFAKQDYEDKYRKQQNLDSLGLLAGGLAHDFNNILTIILGNISLISRSLENTNTSLDKFINSTRLAVSRAKDITKQLLTFSKGGAPIKKITSIEELVVDTTNFHLHGSKVKAEFNIQKGLWLTEIDKNQMSQVISNLVVNATQAMPNGGKISISIENALTNYQHGEMISKNNKFNKITISDTGTGISEEYMDKIFDPYFTTKPMGNGLGLAMVFSIVNKHDGFISVDSIEGVGTKFELYIPAVEIDIKDTVVEKVSNIKEKTKGNILFMDDEDPIRFIIESMLITLGFTAVTVPDGEALIKEYLKSIKLNQKFDLVIMDLIIPGAMGGKETMERLLEIDPDVVALVSSGYSNDPLISNYRDYGFKGVINKPFDLDDLQAIITKIFKYNL
ncbi:MAG: ATP-binding protein, partial [Candidatus Heimdallarchaeota archaeon]|nr:ATP-binding protein [Candidatus Heimdallarchaeota archaeon]